MHSACNTPGPARLLLQPVAEGWFAAIAAVQTPAPFKFANADGLRDDKLLQFGNTGDQRANDVGRRRGAGR